MGGKFSHKLEVFLPWMLLNGNFLKDNWYYPHAGWENFCAKIFPKLLLGQCGHPTPSNGVCNPWLAGIVVTAPFVDGGADL
jgi:hypothetical protein